MAAAIISLQQSRSGSKEPHYNKSMQDTNELFDKYLDDNRMYRFEGTDGVRKLDDLCANLGYTRGQFIGANPIMNFLADNPGAMEAIVEFIRDQIDHLPEWQENLELQMYDEIDEEQALEA